jgi:hypothetical protein
VAAQTTDAVSELHESVPCPICASGMAAVVPPPTHYDDGIAAKQAHMNDWLAFIIDKAVVIITRWL